MIEIVKMPGSQTTLYLLEGKDLIAMDYTGKSDPFICVMVSPFEEEEDEEEG